MTSRRSFLKKSLIGSTALTLPGVLSNDFFSSQNQLPKISLAQWSLNRDIKKGEIKAEAFPTISRVGYGIEAVEYVSTFYSDQKSNAAFWLSMAHQCRSEGVKSLLIMVDAEGELGDSNANKRLKAVDNHKGWVDIAARLQCHSIRVNAFGDGDRATLKGSLVDGLGKLCEYGAKAGINITIENHGLFSSDADFVVEVIKEINNPFMGTLPDFGNWCTSQKWGGTSDNKCKEVFDPAKGVAAFMPYAKGVSAKTYNFNKEGGQPRIDYPGLLKIVKDHGYEGYIGIEYEGNNLSEGEGILATQKLIEKTWLSLD